MLDRWRSVAHTRRVSALFQPFPMLPRRAAQCWRHQPAYRRPRHFHEEPELNLVLKGRARLGVGDGSIELRAGELLLFEPGQDHELLEASPDLDLVVMALRPELAVRVQSERPYVFAGKVALTQGELTAAVAAERALALTGVCATPSPSNAPWATYSRHSLRGRAAHGSRADARFVGYALHRA